MPIHPTNCEQTWDPMKEDYLNPSFNSYTQGPGSRLDRHLQPCFPKISREKTLFKLHVRNIPRGLTETGIKNVFLHFGNPIEIYRHPPVCGPGWAFVLYATHEEAELAIRRLNNMPPFYFKVQFARSPEEKERIRQEKIKDELLQTVLEGESYPVEDERAPFNFFNRGIGRGRAIPFPRQMKMSVKPGKHKQQNSSFSFEELGYFSSYNPGLHHDANRMVMQGVNLTTDSAMGRRIVLMGRGYCVASEKYIEQREGKEKGKTFYDRVNNGLYEFGTKRNLSNVSGKCLCCNKSTVRFCQRCKGWYCSRECQVNDWPSHRSHCSSGIEKSKEWEDEYAKKSINVSILNEPSTFIDRNKPNDKLLYENESGQFDDVGLEEYCQQKEAKMGNIRLTDKLKFIDLPENKFTEVKISFTAGPEEYWVQRQDSESQLLKVMSDLNIGTESPPLEKLEPEMLCSALFENIWYRGKIIQIEPELKVLYIDFGNVEMCTSDQVKQLPESLRGISALSFKIKLAEGTPEKYIKLSEDCKLSIKPVDISEGAIIVHINGEDYPEKNKEELLISSGSISSNEQLVSKIQSSTNDIGEEKNYLLNSVIMNLKPGMKGCCQLQQKIDDRNMTATVVCPVLKQEFSMLMHTLASFTDTCDELYTPNIGDTVAALVESENGEVSWMRAHLLSIDKLYRVNLFDIGLVTTVKKVDILPDNLITIPTFAANCNIIGVDSSIIEYWCKEQKKFKFSVLSTDSTKISARCSLELDAEQECEVIFTSWIVEDKQLRAIMLENNDIVTLSAFFDHKSLFIQHATEKSREILSKLHQDICIYCMTTPMLTKIPHKNDIVACLFEPDGNYYRAQVDSTDDETVKVTYIDFGNEDYVNKDRLKPLRSDLKKVEAMSVKVGLKNTEEKPLTISACKLLTRLIGEEVEMTLIMKGSFKDGIELILPDGENLNNKINECLGAESDNSPEKVKECKIFTEDDLQYLELPINKSIEFAVLHKLDSLSFMGCDANGGDVINYVHDSMSTDINSYCNSMPETFYVPRVGELCFARFEDGLWYRALCISDGIIRENNVMFLDFGNMAFVDKTNMRKMTLEYAEIPAVALFCMLNDLQSNTATDAQKECVDNLVQVNKIYKAHVMSNIGPGIYIIEFPHVTESLAKIDILSENQVPSHTV